MSRRNRQHVGKVVEAAVGRLVAGQKRPHIEVDGEQITDGVVVLGAVETMHGANPPRVRVRFPRPVDDVLHAAGHGAIRRLVRPRDTRRRHRARTQPGDDLFPRFRVRSGRRQIEAVELEPGGVKSLVVTADAVFVDEGARGGRNRRRRTLSLRHRFVDRRSRSVLTGRPSVRLGAGNP